MKKLKFLDFTSHKVLLVGTICLIFIIFGVGISTLSVAIYKNKEQLNPTILEDDVLRRIEADAYIEEPILETTSSDEPNVIMSITEFSNPLPAEYMNNKTSSQGLRNVISAEATGGFSTSGKWHNGNDYPCPDKTPVYATKDGIVREVWPSYYNGPHNYKGHSAYGGLIIIEHADCTLTLYAHLSMTKVHEGDVVKSGQNIAWSGGVKGRRGSGTSTGPHLHYSIYLDIDKLNDLSDST